MSAGSNLYKFGGIEDQLKKFRMNTSRARDPQAVIYQIDRKTLEIQRSDDEIYTDLETLAEELPENSPRYILLSYPLEISGRLSVPYVMIYYMPPTASNELRMLYADAKEKMRENAGTSRVLDISRPQEELAQDALEQRLKG